MTPGSPEAVAAGCKCPASDNHHGKGDWRDGRTFSVSVACRIHGQTLGGVDVRPAPFTPANAGNACDDGALGLTSYRDVGADVPVAGGKVQLGIFGAVMA
jgi:hypothetical protein